jgi:hypothetical protein
VHSFENQTKQGTRSRRGDLRHSLPNANAITDIKKYNDAKKDETVEDDQDGDNDDEDSNIEEREEYGFDDEDRVMGHDQRFIDPHH